MRLSIFTTVFLVFLLVISPLYVLSIAINNAGRNRTKRDIYNSTLNNVDFYVSNLELEIKEMVDTIAEFINNSDIYEVSELTAISDDYPAYTQLERIRKEMAGLQKTYRYIEEAYVLFPLSGIKMTAASRQAMTETDYAYAQNAAFYTGFPFINVDDASDTYINFSSQYFMENPEPERIKYVIVTKLNVEKITREMNEYFSGLTDSTCFIGGTNGLTIVNGIEEAVFTEISAYAATFTHMAIDTYRIESMRADVLIAGRQSEYLKTTFFLFGEEQHLLRALQMYHNWLWGLTGVMVLLLIIFSVWMRSILAVPMNRLIDAIKRGIAGDMHNTIEYKANDEFTYIYSQFNDMLKIQREAINQLYEQKLLIKDTELKMLQYQINPHFLYNCYFIMYQMMEAGEYDALQKMMYLMGSYFNFITKSEGFIPLEKEMKFCADYIGIQSVRFSNRITVTCEAVPEAWKGLMVPRMFIQPLLENCYKHGLVNKEQHGLIRLRFAIAEGIIIVEDNGDELDEETLRRLQHKLADPASDSLSGLINVHKRLQAFLGEGYGLRVDRSPLGGLRVQASIPVEGSHPCINC